MSRPGEIVAKLVRDGEHFRVTGKKCYSTGTAFADYTRINVQDQNDEKVSIVIPVSREGLQVVDDWDGMGQRATPASVKTRRDNESGREADMVVPPK